MRTSTLLGITVMLLLALPAAASDYTLGVFGNANEDATINMQDVTYTELIILEYRDETELSDAKYDGKINMQDVTQIELVILGKEKELTLIDSADRTVTVEMPVENLMSLICENEMIRILGAQDRVVAVNIWEAELHTEDHPVMSGKPVIGSFMPGGVDYEEILKIADQTAGQDIVITYGMSWAEDIEEKLDLAEEIKVVKFDFHKPDNLVPQFKQLAVMFGEGEKCQEYLDWRCDILDRIEDHVQEIPSEEQAKVFYDASGEGHFDTYGLSDAAANVMIDLAGGKSISEDLDIYHTIVEPEWVLVEDPEVIISHARNALNAVGVGMGYTAAADDPSKLEGARSELMETSGIAGTKAVVDGKVYFIVDDLMFGPQQPVGVMYMAKWFYPERFDELNPEEENRKYWEDFMDLEYKGIFVYPEE